MITITHKAAYEPRVGDRVHIRRWISHGLSIRDDSELSGEWTGTIDEIRKFDGTSITQLSGERGVLRLGDVPSAAEPEGVRFCPAYVFLGGSPQLDSCRYLLTEIEQA